MMATQPTDPVDHAMTEQRTLDGGAVFIASFAEFYELHYKKIASALAMTLGDVDLGREAADEAMTRAYQRWGTVSGYRNPAGWVYRVGLNWGRSWYRKAARRLPWVEAGSVELPETSDPALRAALAELDCKYRSVVICRHYFDWSTDQTAEALDIRPGTVKSRLSAGLAQLREVLEDQPPSAPINDPNPYTLSDSQPKDGWQ